MKKVIPVTRVGFHGQTGDDRSPESFAFPACMTSLMEALGDPNSVVKIRAHDRSWHHRSGNDRFLGATGMAFGLLWREDHCRSTLDLTQINDHNETIRRAFAWAGYDYRILTHGEDCAPWEEICASIDCGVPVLAFGLFDPPECAIITGYDEQGHTLIGWSHFQDNLPTEDNGMFRCTGWEESWWKLVLPGARSVPTLDHAAALAHGLRIMESCSTPEDGDALAGQAAYDAWIQSLLALGSADTAACEDWYAYHHEILFHLAELRAWGGHFLEECGAEEAAVCFHRIHDLCWAADAVTDPAGAAALADADKREALAQVLRQIRDQDLAAAASLREHCNY